MDVNSFGFSLTGSPEGDGDRHVGALNGPQTLPTASLAASPNYAQSIVPAPQWVSPMSAAPIEQVMYSVY